MAGAMFLITCRPGQAGPGLPGHVAVHLKSQATGALGEPGGAYDERAGQGARPVQDRYRQAQVPVAAARVTETVDSLPDAES